MILLRCLVLIALLVGSLGAARAEQRIALVVGNGAYDGAARKLAAPPNDARLIADALRSAGFAVTLAVDADLPALRRAIADFGSTLRGSGTDTAAVFYFSGRSVQSFGTSYLLPVDATVSDAADLDFVAVDLASVLRQIGSAPSVARIVIIEAAREAVPGDEAASGAGLAGGAAVPELFLALATRPAGTGEPRRTSLFTSVFARAMLTPGTAIDAAFAAAQSDVRAATVGREVPWSASTLTRPFVFVAPPAFPSAASEMELWADAYGSRDPARLRAFIAAYPESRFAPAARALVATASRSIAPPAPAPSVPQPSPLPSPSPGAGDNTEMKLWASAYGSRDPASLRAFIAAYPESRFAPAARAMIAAAARGTEPAPQPLAPPAAAAQGTGALRIIVPGEGAGSRRAPAPGEMEALELARRSRSPADYRAYIARFPDGVFALLAQAELDALPAAPPGAVEAAAVSEPPAAAPPAGAKVRFEVPLTIGEPTIVGKTLADLITGSPVIPPIAGLPESLWRGKRCTSCHQWDRAGLCTQAQTYIPAERAAALLKEHPYGTSFKTVLKLWAQAGCP